MYAASSLACTCISKAHGGCGEPHSRPVENGAPAKIWALTCSGGCETHLRTDPMWSATLSEIPETYDEKLAREDFDKRGAFDRDAVMAMAMAKLAGVELPETMRRPLTGLPQHIPVATGQVECSAGHPNEPGMKFCGECGTPMRAPAKRACPDGHEVAAKMRFCGECGKGVEPAALDVRAIEPAAPVPPAARKTRLKDRRLTELQQLARDKGLDDSGTRTEVLARLQTAA